MTFDIRTVVLAGAVVNLLVMLVALVVWQTHRRRFDGTGLWAIDFTCQALGLVLILLRGFVPDLLSISLATTLLQAGAWAMLAGLGRFFQRRVEVLPHLVALVAFVAIHAWYTFGEPSLLARNVNLSFFAAWYCGRSAWLLFRQVGAPFRSLARGPAWVLAAIAVTSVGRILVYASGHATHHDYLAPDNFEAVLLLVYLSLNVLLGVSLVMAVNGRLLDGIRQQEEKLRHLFRASPVGIVLSRQPDGVIEEVNDAFLSITGYARDELVGRTARALGFWRTDRERSEALARLAEGGRLEAHDLCIVGRGGREVHVMLSAEKLDLDGHPHMLACIADVTELRRVEAERRRFEATARNRQKLESIGTLASGVAHEINNPLGAMINFAELILTEQDLPDRVRGRVETIIHEGERVARIVRNLLRFSRQEGEARERVQVQDLVENTLSLVQALLRKDDVVVRVDVEQGLPALRCQPQQVEQVLLNLLLNARDALRELPPLPEGACREIRLRASCAERDGRPWVRFVVEDDGPGIPAEVAGRVFDPFFTTKGRDRGTGLGLSISYGIVRDHGGEITFDSAPGRGTRFLVELPA